MNLPNAYPDYDTEYEEMRRLEELDEDLEEPTFCRTKCVFLFWSCLHYGKCAMFEEKMKEVANVK